MKMKRALFVLLALATILFTSCSEEDVESNGSGRAVTFASGISDYNTRVSSDGDQWVLGDSVGVYMLKNSDRTAVGTGNIKYTATNSGKSTSFTTKTPLYYPADGATVDFIAYHPHSTKVNALKYPVDLSSQSTQAALDLMYVDSKASNATGYDKSNESAVNLTFRHILTKVILVVTAADQAVDVSKMGVKAKGMDRTAEFNLLNGQISSRSSNGEITAYSTTEKGRYELTLLPIESLTSSHVVEFTANGKTYTWPISKNTAVTGGSIKQLEGGHRYTFSIRISSSGEVEAIVTLNSGSITPWEDIPGSGTAEEGEEEVTPPVVGDVDPTVLYGYGQNTTGGAGATAANLFHFDDGSCFSQWLKAREKAKSAEPAIVWLSGEFIASQGRNDMFDIKDTKNITFIGANDFVMNKVGFFANRAENIIFRNIYIKQPLSSADGISMQASNNMWVDHCTFESLNQTKDVEDGSCDITHGTKNVTVSWCHFVTTQKSCLVGHSDTNGSEDVNITVTFHHNYFDHSSSRHPRLRYGKAHVYNNFYDNVTTYGAGSAYGGVLLLEDNYFDGVRLPTDICTYPAKQSGSSWVSNLNGKVAGYLYERNNVYANEPSNVNGPLTNVEYTAYGDESTKLSSPLTYDKNFKPSAYTYVVDEVAQIPEIVKTNAGAGKLNSSLIEAKVPVNNGGFAPGEGGGDEGDKEALELGNDWFLLGYNSSGESAWAVDESGTLSLTGAGKLESGAQAMAYLYRTIAGDFTLTAKMESPEFTAGKNHPQAHIGLLLTPNIADTGTDFVYTSATYAANKHYSAYSRVAAGSNRTQTTMSDIAEERDDIDVEAYLKLERSGSTIFSSFSLDGGETYSTPVESTIENLPETAYVGFMVASGDAKITAKGLFSDVKINGEAAPSFSAD